MGVSAHPLLVSNLNGMVRDREEMDPVLESQGRRRRQMTRKLTRKKRSRRVLLKRRTRREGSRSNGIYRRVRNLKKLIPNSQSKGMEGLFRDTADYILSLQMRVEVMQIMVKVFTGSDE